ncbi:hypothetical protein DTO063F5_7138 [Paecilomyces variotii]|nr:hypothetical protein DTO063F5_7138 [Paecilomyces variotii]
MSSRPAKRARVDTDDDVTASPSRNAEQPAPEEIDCLIDDLDENDCRNLLSQAAMAHPDVLRSLRAVVRALEAQAASTVVDFNGHSSDVWKMLNVTYRSASGSAQYEISGQVENSIIDNINDICDQAAKPSASFGTKRNGLEVLRKIGKSIVLSSNTLAHEVQMRFQWDNSLVDGMMDIVNAMTHEEHGMMCFWNDGRGPWQDKMNELVRLSRQRCCFNGLEDVLATLLEYMEEDEEEEQDEEYQSEGFDEDDDQDEVDRAGRRRLEATMEYYHALKFMEEDEEEEQDEEH